MVCKKCGAQILPDDQFCPECGAKVIRKKRCPECGDLYRVGTKFCPNCGAETGEGRSVKRADSEAAPKKKSSSGAAPKRKADPAPPPKKKSVYRDEPPRRRRDWEDEDWDDDDDDEEESVDVLTIMTVAVGCVLLVIVAVLGYNLYQRYVPKNYDRAAEEQQEEDGEEEQDGEEEGDGDGQSLEEQQGDDEEEPVEEAVGGTLVTTAEVNIRDNPSTQGTTVIKKAKKGDSYEYIEAVEGGAWYQILLPDEDGYEYGYVSADYVEIP